ncbi:nucleotidyltransferase family protein [Patescibacteria group bacterium]|nr:nucleotidyltransferase family protein [Patescibacteria group bacterium]MBU1907392.1 nucleotidyltransferase family protein [Patescibacteria group bacterium]
MMSILRVAKQLDLPDWWIGAGFVRNKIWDTLHGDSDPTPLLDVDVIYFNPSNTSEEIEKNYELQLEQILPNGLWSVKNQARMNKVNGDKPYASSLDAISRWPETATAIAVSLDARDQVIFEAMHGVDDLVNLIVRPTPAFVNRTDEFRARQNKKNWISIWPKLNFPSC